MNEKVVVSRIVASESALNGMRKQKAASFVGDIMRKHSKGLFRDEYWTPVQKIWEDFRKENIDWDLISAEYYKDRISGKDAGKKWTFEVNFVNQNGKPDKLHGQVIASFAGSVKDPSEAYDLITTCS